MKSKAITAILLAVSMLIAGCVGSSDKDVETYNNPDVTQNVKSEIRSNLADWCQTGSEYTSKSGTEEVSSKVVGITEFKGREVCEMVYTTNEYSITQYISEDSKFYYQIMKDKSGKVISEGGGNTP